MTESTHPYDETHNEPHWKEIPTQNPDFNQDILTHTLGDLKREIPTMTYVDFLSTYLVTNPSFDSRRSKTV